MCNFEVFLIVCTRRDILKLLKEADVVILYSLCLLNKSRLYIRWGRVVFCQPTMQMLNLV